jgi:peptide/nickel transport system permease protein
VLPFLGRRTLQAIPLLLVISALVFLLIHAAPGGPFAVYLSNPSVRPEDIERLRHVYGLDRPLWQQYWSWIAAFARGDWGYSLSDGRPVAARIVERAPATFELAGTSMLAALALTLPAGIAGAVRRGSLADRVTGAAAVAGISLPAFWFGLLLQMVFAVGLGWLPSSGRAMADDGSALASIAGVLDRVRHLVLPVTVLAVVQAAAWSRYLRGSMIDTLAQPFILAARARGVPARGVILRHALRHAMSAAVAIIMVDAALLVSGAVVTESVFAWPGLGSLFTEALARRDYSVLMALLMLTATAIVVLNIAADAAHALLDPRVAAGP